jgi:hypothetical protein
MELIQYNERNYDYVFFTFQTPKKREKEGKWTRKEESKVT